MTGVQTCALPISRVQWGDLDLSSAAGADAFDARVAAAADRMCRGVKRPASRISDRAFCRAAVRAAAAARTVCAVGPRGLVNDNCVRRVQQEAVRALPAARQDDYARARRGERILAMVAPAWPA